MNAGWYPDPDDPSARRYWDGQEWSAPLPARPTPRPQPAAEAFYPAPPETQNSWSQDAQPAPYEVQPPASHAAPKSRRKPLLLIGAAVVVVAAITLGVLAITGVFSSDGGSGDTIAVSGELALSDTDNPVSDDGYGNDASGISGDTSLGTCEGQGGYSDISDGAQLEVTDESAKTLALSTIGEGKLDDSGSTCTFYFDVSVPAGHKFYGFQVTHRGIVKETEADIRSGVSLTLGS